MLFWPKDRAPLSNFLSSDPCFPPNVLSFVNFGSVGLISNTLLELLRTNRLCIFIIPSSLQTVTMTEPFDNQHYPGRGRTVVNKILDKRIYQGRVQYLVRWLDSDIPATFDWRFASEITSDKGCKEISIYEKVKPACVGPFSSYASLWLGNPSRVRCLR